MCGISTQYFTYFINWCKKITSNCYYCNDFYDDDDIILSPYERKKKDLYNYDIVNKNEEPHKSNALPSTGLSQNLISSKFDTKESFVVEMEDKSNLNNNQYLTNNSNENKEKNSDNDWEEIY